MSSEAREIYFSVIYYLVSVPAHDLLSHFSSVSRIGPFFSSVIANLPDLAKRDSEVLNLFLEKALVFHHQVIFFYLGSEGKWREEIS